jgi:exonuclease SbcC
MAAMSAPERAQFLSRVLGYERLRAAQDRLKETRSALRARLEGLRAGLGDPGEIDALEARAHDRVTAATAAEAEAADAFARAETVLAEVRPRWERLQTLRESALALEAELRVAGHECGAATERAERLERQVAAAAGATTRLQELAVELAPLAGLRQEAAALEQLAEARARRQGLTSQLADVHDHLASVEERLARVPAGPALDAVRARANDVRATITTLTLDAETARTAWVRDAQDARTKRQGLLDQYAELREQRQRLVKAGPEGNCPTCTRPLGAEYEKVLGLLDRQIEEVVSNGNYYKQRIEQLQQEPADLDELERRRVEAERTQSDVTAELGRLEAQAQEAAPLGTEQSRLRGRVGELEKALAREPTEYDERRHAEVQSRIRQLEPLALQAERFRFEVERIALLEEELETAQRIRSESAAGLAEVRARLEGLGYQDAAYREARAAEAVAAQTQREAEVALVRARAETAAVEAVAAVARRRAERAEREREAAAVAGDLGLHQELDRALTELRTELNATLRPDLSDLASGFLRDLTNGRYTDLELDEDYGTSLLDDGDPKSVISGGEEDVANLALRLAISQMIAERAGQPLSLLVLDEIFGSLDEDRRSAVVDLLRSLADRFPQVILITHIDSVREGFDRVIRVGLDVSRGVATVRDEPVGGQDVAA